MIVSSAIWRGLGVTTMSAFENIVCCPNRIAVLLNGLFFFIKSHILSVWTKLLACSQKDTLCIFLSYSPFEMMPCSFGYFPDNMLAWAVQVTAGNTGAILEYSPIDAILDMFGNRHPDSKCLSSRPTTSINNTCLINSRRFGC